MEMQNVTQLQFHVFFIFSLDGDMCSASGYKETAHSNSNGGPKRQLQRGDDRKSVFGYQAHRTERKLSHLLYMDDLKLLGRNEDDLEKEIKIVIAISKDINMNFGLENCAKICLKKGRVQS